MDFADIMLSEISQTMINTVRAHLYVESKKQNNNKKELIEWWLPRAGK